MHPVRVLFETGIELRILPRPAGLSLQLIHHTHPWLTPDVETELHEDRYAWSDVFGSSLFSRHERLSEIARRSGLAEPDLEVADVFDASFEMSLILTCPGGRTLIARPDRLGLAWAFHRDDAGRKADIDFVVDHSDLGVKAPHHASIVERVEKDRATRMQMPGWRRLALSSATDVMTCTHILKQTAMLACSTLRHTFRRTGSRHD